jgi:hypothetical protein
MVGFRQEPTEGKVGTTNRLWLRFLWWAQLGDWTGNGIDAIDSTAAKAIDGADKAIDGTAENLFGAISKPVQGKMLALDDISKTWGTTSWKFACSTDYFNAGIAPNSSALLKYQVMGDIVYYVFDISKLGPDVLNAPGFSMKSLKERIGLTSAATPDEQSVFMLSPQLVLHQGYASKGMLLYVPAGFVIIEFVAKGPLNFGLRKSLFVDQASAKASYTSTVSLLEKEGTNVVRMKTILATCS